MYTFGFANYWNYFLSKFTPLVDAKSTELKDSENKKLKK
jgi:hypothetical protein